MHHSRMAPCTVLMVAEKPSLAQSIAEFLSDRRVRGQGGGLAAQVVWCAHARAQGTAHASKAPASLSCCPALCVLCLMQMYSRRASLDVHEFEGTFRGRPARFKMTSVIGAQRQGELL